jgi:putative acetyltransferase
MNATIRTESASDIIVIETVTAQAFFDAEHTSHTEQFIVNALRNSGMLSVSLVAEIGGEVVGHVGVSPVSISGGQNGWFGLAPVSVVPGCQRQGIGGQLVTQALKRLRTQAANGCVVLGDPKYYSRFGFKSEPMLVLPGAPPEYFQALSFGDPVPAGVVSYHQAFDALA